MERRNYAESKEKFALGQGYHTAAYVALTGEWQTAADIAGKLGISLQQAQPSLAHVAQTQWNVQRWERIGKPTMYRRSDGVK